MNKNSNNDIIVENIPIRYLKSSNENNKNAFRIWLVSKFPNLWSLDLKLTVHILTRVSNVVKSTIQHKITRFPREMRTLQRSIPCQQQKMYNIQTTVPQPPQKKKKNVNNIRHPTPLSILNSEHHH